MDKLLTKKQVCEQLGITHRTFEKYAREDGLPVIPISSHRKYVHTTELNEWLIQKQKSVH